MENENITREEELLVEHFFTECKTDLPDNGFTRRVMSNLPQKACRYNNIWSVLCLLIVWSRERAYFYGKLRSKYDK